MRSLSLIAALPLLALTACGGASGPTSVGSVAPPTGSGGTGGGVTPAPSPTPTPGSGGTGGGVTPAPTPTPGGTPTPTSFLDVSTAKTVDAIGTFHSVQTFPTSNGIVYLANAGTVRTPSGTITYNPRDGIFTANLVDAKAGLASANTRYQDPGHNTDFDKFRTPEWGVPNFAGFNYVEAGSTETVTRDDGTTATTIDSATFFYQRPGAATTYHVSLAGFVRNIADADGFGTFLRGTMVFGDQTPRSQIPGSGSGVYRGGFIASMVGNQTTDNLNPNPNYFQWIVGESRIDINFGQATMGLFVKGDIRSANQGGFNVLDKDLSFPTGSKFEAQGSGTIDLVRTGGFTGSFAGANNYVRILSPTGTLTTISVAGISQGSSTTGASSIDGTFFGPNAVNVGGNLRIVGGVPDQRVDIHGAFTGAKQ